MCVFPKGRRRNKNVEISAEYSANAQPPPPFSLGLNGELSITPFFNANKSN